MTDTSHGGPTSSPNGNGAGGPFATASLNGSRPGPEPGHTATATRPVAQGYPWPGAWTAPAAPPAPPAPRRLAVLHGDDVVGSVWGAKWWILLTAVVVAALTLLASLLVPPTYGSSADIRLTVVGQPNTPASDAVKASNDIASQYAQDVTSDAVITPAAAAAGVSPADLRARTSAGTVSGQNVVRVNVQAADPTAAARQTQRVADTVVTSVVAGAVQQAAVYQQTLQRQLAPLDQQIAATRTEAVTAPPGAGGPAQTRLAELVDRRAQLVGSAAVQSASMIPQVSVSAAAGPGVRVAPDPVLYTVVAFVVALFLAVQAAVLIGRRRREQR
jgi:capsular polysaccharide biosynthesis protein